MLGGGATALQDISRLEDPEFTIKEAKVYTLYPGATPQEVEREITYHIENAVQQLTQLKRVGAISQNGFSEVTVKIKDKFKKPDFPNIWDELRRKVTDAQSLLPPGSQTSVVFDDFGDVFGLFYALTGEDYSYRELKDYADILMNNCYWFPAFGNSPSMATRKRLPISISPVPIWQNFGISNLEFHRVLKSQNLVSIPVTCVLVMNYIRINPTGQLLSVQEIGELLVSGKNETLVRIKDIATVRRA